MFLRTDIRLNGFGPLKFSCAHICDVIYDSSLSNDVVYYFSLCVQRQRRVPFNLLTFIDKNRRVQPWCETSVANNLDMSPYSAHSYCHVDTMPLLLQCSAIFSKYGPPIFQNNAATEIQCPPLNRITLGYHKSDNNNRMIQLSNGFCVL